MRQTQRPRRETPQLVLWALRPVLHYSSFRDAWVLKGVGQHRGPVLVRRGAPRGPVR